MRSKDGERKKKARERQTEIERNKRGKSERKSKRFRGRRTKTDKRIDRGRKREREKYSEKSHLLHINGHYHNPQDLFPYYCTERASDPTDFSSV